MAIKPVDRSSTVRLIWSEDPAIDRDSTDLDALAKSLRSEDVRGWRDIVKFKDGEEPTYFDIGVIPTEVLIRIEDDCGLNQSNPNRLKFYEACWRCFLYGLREMENGPTMTETDRSGNRREVVPKKTVDGVEYVDPVWLKGIFVGPLRKAAQEIGLMAWRWHQLTDMDAK